MYDSKQAVLSAITTMEMFENTYFRLLDGRYVSHEEKDKAAEAFYLLQDRLTELQFEMNREARR